MVVVSDRRHTRFLEYREGSLTEKPGLVAFGDVGDVADSGVAKRAARSSGVRGATAKDLANRFLEVEADRLHQAVVERIQELVSKDGLILLGGPSETAAHLMGMPWVIRRPTCHGLFRSGYWTKYWTRRCRMVGAASGHGTPERH